ncbi:MAG: hypothetical protein KDN20_24420 [Verrucomicrobiae bacterium]|nr:hypothetical protein [Verrucomicrobiae bacterium]
MKFSPRTVLAFLWLLFAPGAFAQQNIEPEVFTLTFSEKIAPLLNREVSDDRPEQWPDWITGISQSNGALKPEGTWQGELNPDGVETAFNLLIDNPLLNSDLALTLSFSVEKECDFAIQIFDANNQVVAVDLFGNVAENSARVGTDTYIIPLSNYPSASRVAIRQVSGQLTLFGMLAFPVISELPADPEAEMTMLKLLGGELSESSRLYQALNELIPDTNSSGLTDKNGEPLSREEIISSLRTEVIRDLAKTNTEFEQRLIGTEWYLEDFYQRRLARFLPGGVMLQQHTVEGKELRWSRERPELKRNYRVLNNNSVLFGIGGFIATFNDNFTEMTYETAQGWKGKARLVGKFQPTK